MTAWQRFWYSPSSPWVLGMGRAVFCTVLLLDALLQQRALWARVADVFYNPILIMRPLGRPEYVTCVWLEQLWQVALLLAAVGLFTRWSMLATAVLGTYVMGLPSSFCSFSQGNHHHYNLACIILWILALSRCGDACSIDAWWSRRRPDPSPEYTWPVRLTWIGMTCMFWGAGLIKLRISGWAWILPENFSNVLIRRHYFDRSPPPTDWGLALSQYPLACSLLALMALLLEVLYPLGLLAGVWPRSRWRWAVLVPVSMALAVVGIRFLMGPGFLMPCVAHIFWWPQKLGNEPSVPRTSSRVTVWVVFWLTLAGHLFDFVKVREDFPFSSYPMFATLSRPQLSRYLLYGVSAEGSEWMLQPRLTYPPEDPTLDRISLHRTFEYMLARQQDVSEGMLDCLKRYRAIGYRMQALRLYQCHWKVNWRLEGRDNPEKTLVVEVR